MSEQSAGEEETSQVVYGLRLSCSCFCFCVCFTSSMFGVLIALSSVQLLFCCLFVFFLCKSLSLVLQDSAVSGSRKRKRVSRLFIFSFLSQGLEGCKCSAIFLNIYLSVSSNYRCGLAQRQRKYFFSLCYHQTFQ